MRFKVLTILIFIIINYNIFSQGNFAIGFNATPAVTYSYSPSDLPSPKSNFGYSLGINGVYYFNSNLFFETGINYQKKRVLFIKNVLDTRNAWIDVNGDGIFDIAIDRIDYSRITYRNYYMSYSSVALPLLINYRTSDINSTGFVGSLGINFNYIYNIEGISESNTFGELSEGNKSLEDFSSSLSIGIALYQPISSKICFIGGPKYYFDFYSGIENFNPKFHTVALELKLLYSW